jgi:anti-anti-sigma factor
MVETADVHVTVDDTSITIVGGGTLDLSNSKEFHDGLREASLAAKAVTVDLRPADFIDTAVVQDLAKGAITMMKRGRRLKVIASEGAYPLRVLRITGFGSIMDIEVSPAG